MSVRDHQNQWRRVSVLRGLILAVVFAKYHSAERMDAGYLILSDLTLKIEPVFQNIVAFGQYQKG
jgi:hypothetical protein